MSGIRRAALMPVQGYLLAETEWRFTAAMEQGRELGLGAAVATALGE